MKLVKTIKCGDYYTDVEIKLKVKTNHLTRNESYEEFDKILDKLARLLFEKYNFQDIRLS